MTKVHARLAPSSAADTVQCPGSVTMRERYPEDEDSEAAREGEAAHWVVEEMVEGVIVPVGHAAPNGVIVSPEMIKGGHMMVADMQGMLGANWRAMVKVEQTLPPDAALHPLCFGTPDAFAIHGATIYLWDYKFGFSPVDVRENWQLIVYLALLFKHLSLGDDRQWRVRFAIVQPRDYSGGERGVKVWEIGAHELRAHINVVRNAFAEALGPNPRLRVGPGCRNCSARHACPELQRAGLLEAELGQQAQPFDLSPGALGLELQMLERAIATLTARKTGLDAQAIRAIKAGAQVPGYAVSRGDGRVVWNKPANMVINTGKLLGFDLAKPPEPITPKQAMDLGMPAEIVGSWSESKPGAEKLVPDNGSLAARVFGN